MSSSPVLGPYCAIIWSRKYSSAEYRRWAAKDPRFLSRRVKKFKAMSQASSQHRRQESRESIKFCEHDNHQAAFKDLDDVLVRTRSNGSRRANLITSTAVRGIRSGISGCDLGCTYNSKCQGTIKLVWYSGGRLRGKDDVFHVVDRIVDDFQAVIFVSENSTVTSSAESEGTYPAFLGKESKSEEAERKRRDEEAERQRKAEREAEYQRERDRQLAKKAHSMAANRHARARH